LLCLPYKYYFFWTISIVLCLSKSHPVYLSKLSVSETGFCLRLQVKPTQLGPIDRASPYLRTNVPSSQKFRAYLFTVALEMTTVSLKTHPGSAVSTCNSYQLSRFVSVLAHGAYRMRWSNEFCVSSSDVIYLACAATDRKLGR
jgi:hypothetical protein